MTSDEVRDASLLDSHPTTPTSKRRISRRKQPVQRRSVSAGLPPSLGPEEVLVVDDRAHLRPAQIVESKLTRLLQAATVPVSHLQNRGLLRAR